MQRFINYRADEIILKRTGSILDAEAIWHWNDSNDTEVRNLIGLPKGFTAKNWRIKGSTQNFKLSTFFPSNWTSKQIGECLQEAWIDACKKHSSKIRNHKLIKSIRGYSSKGISIEFKYLNTEKRTLRDAYPSYPKATSVISRLL